MGMQEILIIIVLALALLAVSGLFLRALYEPHQLRCTQVVLGRSKDEDCPGLTVAFFSDLHGSMCKVSDDALLRAIFAKKIDVILFGGDVGNKYKASENTIGLRRLSAISEMAQKEGVLCYAVRGNHDWQISREEFTQSGFLLLDNENTRMTDAVGNVYLLMGADDLGNKPRIWPRLSDTFCDEIPVERRIVLVHNPDFVDTTQNIPYTYILSGHFHGGQIYMPFHLEFRILRTEKLPRDGITRGEYRRKGVLGYISRGIGCVVFPLRLLSTPEITHITIPSDFSHTGKT